LFPYLAGIIEDELISVDNFSTIILDKPLHELKEFDLQRLQQSLPLKLSNSNTKLAECLPGMWRFTAFKDESLFEPNVSISDLQKKIIPWHSLMPRQEEIDDFNSKNKINSNHRLILVASLIDKGHNLGGLY
jgi:hypothetical protein